MSDADVKYNTLLAAYEERGEKLERKRDLIKSMSASKNDLWKLYDKTLAELKDVTKECSHYIDRDRSMYLKNVEMSTEKLKLEVRVLAAERKVFTSQKDEEVEAGMLEGVQIHYTYDMEKVEKYFGGGRDVKEGEVGYTLVQVIKTLVGGWERMQKDYPYSFNSMNTNNENMTFDIVKNAMEMAYKYVNGPSEDDGKVDVTEYERFRAEYVRRLEQKF